MSKDTRITTISFKSSGHWEIIVRKYNWRRKYPFGISSITTWTHTTTVSMSVDDYRSDDDRRQNRGEKALIRQAKWLGIKEIEKYR